jgi:hypothetical protein
MKSVISCLTCLLISSLLYLACKKNGSSSPSKMTLITQASWKFDTAGLGNDSSGVIVTALPPGLLLDCQKDNIFTFNSDGTGVDDEGPTKCNPASPQTTPFTWSFNANQNAIVSSDSLFSGIGGTITITLLTSTQLHLMKDVTVQGIPFIVDIYLKH